MRRIILAALALFCLGSPGWAESCTSLVQSVCGENQVQPRRALTVAVAPPAFAKGDRFPVKERSLLMNPTRHRLPKVDGAWRYYAMDGVVYKVDIATATVIEVIRDNRTWGLR